MFKMKNITLFLIKICTGKVHNTKLVIMNHDSKHNFYFHNLSDSANVINYHECDELVYSLYIPHELNTNFRKTKISGSKKIILEDNQSHV